MKRKLKLYAFLCFVLVGSFSLPVIAEVQTTFTKSNNVITVKVTSDTEYVGVLNNFACTFRFPNAGGATLSMISTNVLPMPIITTIVDPTDANFNIARLEQYDGVTGIHWYENVEANLFTFSISGGLGTTPLSLASESGQTYAFVFYQLAPNIDITNLSIPFYAGTDNLAISTLGTYTLATENLLLGKYWLTSGTSNWSTGSNWSDGFVPTAGQNIAIPGGGTQPIAGAGSVCNKLVIESGATVNVANNGTLTVDGNLTITDASALVVNSSVAGTGSLIVNGTLPTGDKVKVQRYIASADWATGRDGWHFLSSPVSGQAVAGSFLPTGGGNDYDMYVHDEPSHYWKNQKEGANSALFVNFVVGKGYLVSYEQNSTKEFVGQLTNTNVIRPITNSGNDDIYGFNFVGNPFSSALTWDNSGSAYGDQNHICNFAYIWNSAAKDYDVLDAGGILPAMNGFMVYTDLASTSVTLPAAKRVHDAAAWYKSAGQQIKLIARDPEGTSFKSSYIKFNTNATAGFELNMDAPMITGGFAPLFYSTADNRALTVNTLPEAGNGLVIPFGFVKNEFSNFTIELAENIDGTLLVLRDKKTNTMVNLKQGTPYAFSSAAGDDANRFELLFGTQLGISEVNALTDATAYSFDNRIIINNVSGDTKMDIYTVQGQLLKNFQFNSNGNHEISVNLPTGIYMVRLSNGGAMKTMKVFVK